MTCRAGRPFAETVLPRAAPSSRRSSARGPPLWRRRCGLLRIGGQDVNADRLALHVQDHLGVVFLLAQLDQMTAVRPRVAMFMRGRRGLDSNSLRNWSIARLVGLATG